LVLNEGKEIIKIMSQNRIFTEQELKELGARTLDLVLAAIDAGDKEKAKSLAMRMYRESNLLHDGSMFWIAGLQTYIYEKLGIEALEEAERAAHIAEGKTVFTPPEKTDLRSQVEHLAGVLHGHLQPVTIVEDDDTISLTMQPCGSGERIIQKGGYSPEVGLAKIPDPHPITWGMKDFPIYCTHCPILERMQVEGLGHLGACRIVSEPIKHGSCQFVFYKDPDAIPEDFYTRIGKNKPVTVAE
jgi:hypothetical protein